MCISSISRNGAGVLGEWGDIDVESYSYAGYSLTSGEYGRPNYLLKSFVLPILLLSIT